MKKDEMQHSIESAGFMALCKRIIGPKEDPYLIRYILIQTPLFSIYVHKLVRSDYERALHDHPWDFISLILKNGYSEEVERFARFDTVDGSPLHVPQPYRMIHKNKAGQLLFRKGEHRHRVIIEDLSKPGWTLVLTGRRKRKWGFWVLKRKVDSYFQWCHWKKFNRELGICESEPIAGRTGLD